MLSTEFGHLRAETRSTRSSPATAIRPPARRARCPPTCEPAPAAPRLARAACAPLRGTHGVPGRTARAIELTLGWSARELSESLFETLIGSYNPSFNHGLGGLHGGYARQTHLEDARSSVTITFHHFSYVPGVTSPARSPTASARLTIGGPRAAARQARRDDGRTSSRARLGGVHVHFTISHAAARSALTASARALRRRARWPTRSRTRPRRICAPTRSNPVDWLPWGEQALARARELDRPLLVSIGYAACHWCHVMERESFEDEATAALLNEHFVARQGRPRGAPGHRRHLHGGGPGADRPRRLAAERLPDARPGAVLRRHLLAAGSRAAACRASRQVLEAVAAALARAPRRGGRAPARASPLAWAAPRRSSRRRAARHAARSSAAIAALRRDLRRAQRRLRRRAEVPAALRARAARAPRGERELSTAHAARDGAAAASATRSAAASRATRSTPRWTVPHFEKMLYDNALLARAYLHAWQDERRSAVRAHVPRDARVLPARAARARGRLLLLARRRLRGRRGTLLRLDASRELHAVLGRARAGRDRLLRSHRARATSRARTCSRRAAREPAERERDPRAAARRPRAARAPGARRQAPALLERADDRRARRRRRRARRAALPRGGASRRRSSCGSGCATATAGCCGPTTTARRACPPTSRTTRSCSRRCSRSMRRPSRSASSRGRARSADAILARFADPRARRLLRHAPTTASG